MIKDVHAARKILFENLFEKGILLPVIGAQSPREDCVGNVLPPALLRWKTPFG